MLMLLALACLLFAHDKMILVQIHASNPDPLQDFCVADLSATAPSVNGFPCKLRSNVTAKDFLLTGLPTSGPGGCGMYGLCIN